MLYSGDKELARWTQPVTCGQWFYIQMDAGDEWCPSGLCLGMGTVQYLHQWHREWNRGLSLKVCWRHKAEQFSWHNRRTRWYAKGPGQTWKWAHKNFTKINKSMWKVLHLGQGSPRNEYRLGEEAIESSSVEKYFKVPVDKVLNLESTVWACSSENQPHSGLHQKRSGQQVKWSGQQVSRWDCPSPVSSWDLICSSASWGPQHKNNVEMIRGVQ